MTVAAHLRWCVPDARALVTVGGEHGVILRDRAGLTTPLKFQTPS